RAPKSQELGAHLRTCRRLDKPGVASTRRAAVGRSLPAALPTRTLLDLLSPAIATRVLMRPHQSRPTGEPVSDLASGDAGWWESGGNVLLGGSSGRPVLNGGSKG